MSQEYPFLKTKFHIPVTRKEIVSRESLLKRLVEGFGVPLTLVTAPAGYGKTTLVALGLAACGQPAAWLSLEKADNQTERFFTYLVIAIQQSYPEIGKKALENLLSGQPAQLEGIMAHLINDLDGLVGALILVLDDYQVINNPAIHEGIGYLLDHCPNALHIVMTTRSDPPLPLPRLRARGQVVELRAAELRFTFDEATCFLNDVMGLHLDRLAVEALAGRTEGWIAGLQMAALSLRDRKDVNRFIASFSGTNRFILDYLLEEVLQHQPLEVQQFLLSTSILERMSAPICDFLLSQEENQGSGGSSTAILDALDRANLFLVALDDERVWYRYHHLFAELLQARLAYLYPDLKLSLHRRAADWLEMNHMTIEAVNHALVGGAHEQAARLVEENTTVLLARGELNALTGWIEALPVDLRRSRPRLCIHQAYALAFAGKLQGVEDLLRQAELAIAASDLTADEAQALNGSVAAVRGMAMVMSGHDEEGISQGNLARELLSPAQLWDRATVAWSRGYAERSLGQLGEASQAFEEMVRLAREMGNPWTLVSGLMDLAMVVRSQGQLYRARSLFEEALRSASQQGARGFRYIARMETGLASILYEQDELNPAQQLLEDALSHIDQWPNPNHLAYADVIQSRVLLGLGDYSGARQAIERADQVCRAEIMVRNTRRMVEMGLVRLWLKQTEAQILAQPDGGLEDRCASIINTWREEISGPFRDTFDEAAMAAAIMLARISLVVPRAGDFPPAGNPLPLLGRVTEQAQRMGNISAAVEALALSALAQYKLDNRQEKEALVLLEAALRLAQPGGFVRTFLDEGRPLQYLLMRWLNQAGGHPLQGYAKTLLEKFDPQAESTHIEVKPVLAQPLPEPLSQREIEVLTWIARGLTNDGIARQLFISPGTVKAHTAAIYRKLDVASRTEAVARARALQLLP